MRTYGIVRQWNADKGFGFIQGAASTQVFFHVRDFRGTAPPAHGMPVEYEEIHVGGKGPRAMDVRPRSQPSGSPSAHRSPARAASAPPSTRPTTRPTARPTPATARHTRPRSAPQAPAGAGIALALMLLWLGLWGWGAWAQRLPLWWLGATAALNLLTFFTYALDKSAAQRGTWRTRESHLHLLALLGGWPAAWWAQQWLRHKSRKQDFRAVYWGTVVLNCAALAVWTLRPHTLREVLSFL